MCGPKYVFKIMYVSIISVYTVHDCQENKYMKYIWFEQNTDAEWIYLFFIFLMQYSQQAGWTDYSSLPVLTLSIWIQISFMIDNETIYIYRELM